MDKTIETVTKADLDSLKQAIGKVAPKAATAKGGRISLSTYTR